MYHSRRSRQTVKEREERLEQYNPKTPLAYSALCEPWRSKPSFYERYDGLAETKPSGFQACVYKPEMFEHCDYGCESERSGFVYFFCLEWIPQLQHGGHCGPFKIGCSENPYGRMKDLQTGCPWTLVEYKSIFVNDMHYFEAMIHRELIGLKMRGEWYNINAYTLEMVLTNTFLYQELPELTCDEQYRKEWFNA